MNNKVIAKLNFRLSLKACASSRQFVRPTPFKRQKSNIQDQTKFATLFKKREYAFAEKLNPRKDEN